MTERATHASAAMPARIEPRHRPHSGRKGFSAVPVLGDLLAMGRLLVDREAGWGPRLLVVVMAAYLAMPVDAIPELIAPFIGWLDDLGAVVAVRLMLHRKLLPYRYPLFARREPAPGREI